MNFDEDIRQHVLRTLPYNRKDLPLARELHSKATGELLIIYFNWLGRFVVPRPRAVHRSKQLLINSLATKFAGPLSTIVQDIEQGNDLTRYLSTRVLVGYESASKGRKVGAAKGPL